MDNNLYLKVGSSNDLKGKDRFLYRILEIFPGLLSWSTIIGIVLLSFFAPTAASYFIIAFSLYWLLRTIYLSAHLRHNWKRLKHNMSVDWTEMLSKFKYEHLIHLVILPYYEEPIEVIEKSIKAIVESDGDNKKRIIVLAAEERAGESAILLAENMKEKYGNNFLDILITTHPKDIPGEMAGKGSNISYAAEEARVCILDKKNIKYEDVIVSAFDIDTVVYPQYFQCLSWHFLAEEDPFKVSFQPVPLFNNNIWDAPALSRVVAVSSTFWQMIQQERPEKMSTFSSHAVSFKSLYEIDYWQKNMVSEDSRIFWNLLLANKGNYSVVPLAYPVSMDANVANNLWNTSKNVYKQHRRWTWGVENVPYIIFNFIKDKDIPLRKKWKFGFVQVEGFWSLVTNPLILFTLGWLPLVIGGNDFNNTILSYNLPIVARSLLTVAMFGLIISAIISISLLPKRDNDQSKKNYVYMALQWILVPFTMIVFSAIPGLDSQTRLLFGKSLGFWVTPKLIAAK